MRYYDPKKNKMPAVRREHRENFRSAFYYLYSELFQGNGFGIHAPTGRVTINWKDKDTRRRVLGFVSYIVRTIERDREYWLSNNCNKLKQYLAHLDRDIGCGQANMLANKPRETHYHRIIEKGNLVFELICRLADRGARRAQIPYFERGSRNRLTSSHGWGQHSFGYPY